MNLIPKFIYKIQSTRCLDFSSLKKSDYKSLINHINSKPITDLKKFQIFNLLNGYIKCFFYKLIFKKYNLTKTYLINIFLVTIILLSIFIIKFKYYSSSKSPDISNTTNLITSTSENIKTKEAGTKSTSKSVEITNNTTKTDSPNKKKFSDNKSIDNNDSTYTTSPNNSKTNISELPTTTTVPTKERIEPTKEVSVKSSRVTLLNKTLVENNSVGNEWDVQIFINNKILDSNVVLLDTDEITAHIKVTENDKKPDTAEKTIGLKKGLTTFNITVKENLGRYSGNTATWAFKFQVE